ncbi:Potassium voltage-gated channel [Tumidithrix helvetica PCC 7403]|uniref:potassium channel family protein n=1 Tax=Tumidithrix helvetica TaxID=3457545 RepID=UPI003CB98E3B
MSDSNLANRASIDRERREILQQVEEWLEIPMLVLSFAWTALLIVEFVWGLFPLLNTASITIWIVFILDFMLRLWLTPQKLNYLKHNWLTAFALLLPALWIFRVTRIIRVLGIAPGLQGLQLLRVLARINRGMKSLSGNASRRGFGYVVALTLFVALMGAAGMYEFERNETGSTLTSYGNAIWWTAMVMTTMGSDYFPKTSEGRVLCFLLAVYSFAIFGYATAILATFFVGQDVNHNDADIAREQSLQTIQAEIAALRKDIQSRL